jgi:hypothetical protein
MLDRIALAARPLHSERMAESPRRADERIQRRFASRPVLVALVAILAWMALVAALGSLGASPASPVLTLIVVLDRLVGAGWPVVLALLSAIGLGLAIGRATGLRGAGLDNTSRGSMLPVCAALGIAAWLTLVHALGVLGFLRGVGAWLALVPGFAAIVWLALDRIRERDRKGESTNSDAAIRPISLPTIACVFLALVPAALLAAAACEPPGWLWSSEARGYDALSYHLQLPQEWIASGRIAPRPHNVYSFLPSAIESAFVHLGVLAGAGGPGSDPMPPWGLLANEGAGAYSAQLLSATFVLLTAWTVSGLLRRLAPAGARAAPMLLGIACVSIPWLIVTGSLAYNDPPVLFFFAAGAIAASDRALSPLRRGAIVGVLTGAACGCKPTAMLFVAIPLGVLLLANLQRGKWIGAMLAATIAGGAMLAPWLIRNAIASGNPVFPFASSIFGRGSWSPEQIERYNHAHHATMPVLDRVRLLVMPNASDPAGKVHRGMLHPQWSIFFPVVLAGAIGAMWPSTRAQESVDGKDQGSRFVAYVWGVMLIIQIALWLLATHLQSRFLLPLAVPGIALVAMGLARLPTRVSGALAGIFALVLSIHSIVLFAAEPVHPAARPNALLLPGTMLRTGEIDRDAIASADANEKRRAIDALGPEAFVNLMLSPSARVLLVGGATPFYIARPVVYSTAWDDSLLARSFRDHAAAGSGQLVAGDLRAAGITHLLVDFAELDRLGRSGFRDPALDPARIREFLRTNTRLVRSWDDIGVVLVEVPSP